ncbi:methyltransferase domain-containing protein [Streptomyces sp. NPDC059455]|uniref:methyltransferase domain-containing protein n=1 Tax=Streptomyces sp. NPDC059455 TaxID=3346837 RepID=UPI0036AB10D5
MFETPLSALDFLDKTEIRRLFGPEDRMPADYRGPHSLSHRGWRTRSETIRALPGHAEAPPFPDRSFDAVMAAWVLPYVDDVVRAVREMIRVCDETDAAARIVLIGGGRDNELVSLINQVCVPLAGEPHDHQGFLLATAARVLAEAGFSRLAVWRTEAALHFPESVLEERVVAAAGVLVDFWYEGHARAADMKEALRPVLYRHFEQRPHAIGDQGVVLIARPAARS